MLNLLLILTTAVALDVAWVLYMEAAHKGTIAAALWSMALGALGFLSVDAFLTGWLARVIWVLGLGMGTFIGLYLKKRLHHTKTEKPASGMNPKPDHVCGSPWDDAASCVECGQPI